MGYFDFRQKLLKPTSSAMDERTKVRPTNETLAQHLKHCQAMKNGHVCPFVRKMLDVDELDRDKTFSDEDPDVLSAVEEGKKVAVTTPEDGEPISPLVFEKLASYMTDMWRYTDTLDQTRISDAIVNKAINAGLAAISEILTKEKCVVGTGNNNEKIVIIPPPVDGGEQ